MMSRSGVPAAVCFSSFTVLLALLLLPGCGSEDTGPERYAASGTVTFRGEPLASGRITFAPDTEKGNSGPAGYTMIHDGKYDTDSAGSKSPVAGEHTVLITGYDQSSTGEGEPRPPLFQDYRTTARIDPEAERTELNFDVPADAGNQPGRN
ncbi:MAG: hypothetical protein KDA79_23190 [Planctomycetaceae bacterium]|nr:hypothetical protein [Planctomycetaceae bacterium]